MERRTAPEGSGANPRSPACHAPGMAASRHAAEAPLFVCEAPDCVVQTFDAEGAQSVQAPEPFQPDGNADGDGR